MTRSDISLLHVPNVTARARPHDAWSPPPHNFARRPLRVQRDCILRQVKCPCPSCRAPLHRSAHRFISVAHVSWPPAAGCEHHSRTLTAPVFSHSRDRGRRQRSSQRSGRCSRGDARAAAGGRQGARSWRDGLHRQVCRQGAREAGLPGCRLRTRAQRHRRQGFGGRHAQGARSGTLSGHGYQGVMRFLLLLLPACLVYTSAALWASCSHAST